MNKKIRLAVIELILGNQVLSVEKTKGRENGGKQVVTIGPYQEAVSTGKNYLVSTKNGDAFFYGANQAAADFIRFVDAAHAEEAVRTALRSSGWDVSRLAQYKRILGYINRGVGMKAVVKVEIWARAYLLTLACGHHKLSPRIISKNNPFARVRAAPKYSRCDICERSFKRI